MGLSFGIISACHQNLKPYDKFLLKVRNEDLEAGHLLSPPDRSLFWSHQHKALCPRSLHPAEDICSSIYRSTRNSQHNTRNCVHQQGNRKSSKIITFNQILRKKYPCIVSRALRVFPHSDINLNTNFSPVCMFFKPLLEIYLVQAKGQNSFENVSSMSPSMIEELS